MSLITVSRRSADELHHPEVLALLGGELGVERQLGHADDAVHRRADLVAHVGQELALGPAGGLGGLLGPHQLPLHLLPLGDVREVDDGPLDLPVAAAEGVRGVFGREGRPVPPPEDLVIHPAPLPGPEGPVDRAVFRGVGRAVGTGVVDQRVDVLAEHVVGPVAEHLRGRPVDEGAAASRVDRRRCPRRTIRAEPGPLLRLPQGGLGPPLGVDVGVDPDPLPDPAPLVQDGDGPDEHVPVLAVVPPQPVLDLVERAGGDGRGPDAGGVRPGRRGGRRRASPSP